MKGIEDRICYVWELFHIGSYMKAIFAAFETHITRFGELLMTGVQLPPPHPRTGSKSGRAAETIKFPETSVCVLFHTRRV